MSTLGNAGVTTDKLDVYISGATGVFCKGKGDASTCVKTCL